VHFSFRVLDGIARQIIGDTFNGSGEPEWRLIGLVVHTVGVVPTADQTFYGKDDRHRDVHVDFAYRYAIMVNDSLGLYSVNSFAEIFSSLCLSLIINLIIK
jgi:hypothetical protein